VSVMLRGCISLPITFRTPENFRTESMLFDVAEVRLPFNAILGRPALYRFMAVTHYGYLVLKMPSPGGVLRMWGDRDAGACALEKLQALAAAREAVAEPRDQSTASPRATLSRRGRPHEDHSYWGRCCSDYSYLG
jgi:hypothetical protein